MKRIWLVVLIALFALPAHAQKTDDGPDCSSLADCLAILRTYHIEPPPGPGNEPVYTTNSTRVWTASKRLSTFGDPAVVALLDLLKDPNPHVRLRAASALGHFARIDARHLPDLIAAHRAGVNWLERPIVTTGTDAAFQFIWAEFQKDFGEWSSSSVTSQLERYGDRLLPKLEDELRACRTSSDQRLCDDVFELINKLQPYPASALPLIEAIARSSDASDEIR